MNKDILENKYKISIIVPVYNTECYFKRCIESILKQSYKNLEIIIVDDNSPGNIKELSQFYVENDHRVQVISHETNKGLFQARLTGAKKATGQYIAFVDSDDYVSLDYYHTLLDRIVTQCADIAIGHTVHCNPDGYKYIYNMHDACFNFEKIQGDEIKTKFFGQKGLCYSWHTIWNKLYSKRLWDKCMPYYSKMDGHLIMTEDIAFSSVLFYFAQSITTTSNDAYFYCANDSASTNASNISMEKFEKNMCDIKKVFDFVDSFLKEIGAVEEIVNNFHEFRRYYARIWANVPKYQLNGMNVIKGKKILKEFCPEETECLNKDDHFFSSITTQWNGGLENLKERIILSNDKYISFDIFDTLINRPFYDPADLFELIDKDFEKLVSTSIKFKKIRMDTEAVVREEYGKKQPEWQDVTIDEIYEGMSALYDIPSEITEKLKKREYELELEFCNIRNAGKELYEAALLTGKKIIIISDMYLKQHAIENILNKNGYHNYFKIYISSELRLTKNQGKLYQYVRKDLNISDTTHIFHIGDTWQNDYVNAESNGFSPIFFPKAKEVFENKIQGMCTNNCADIMELSCANIMDIKKTKQSLGISSMLAVIYNKYFDNPYRTFNQESDFNIDPYFIGYYTLGMHLVGLCFWIIKECKERKIDTIHFLARDGYMPMRAYNILHDCFAKTPYANYLYASRKAVLPGMIRSKYDFYDLPIEYKNHSPKTIIQLLEFACDSTDLKTVKKICTENDISYEKTFPSKGTYLSFISIFLNELFDKKKFTESFNLAKEYFSVIGKNDITFDMGYSGRIQKALSTIVGRGIDVLFVHSDHTYSSKMQRLGDFSIYNFYDFIPSVSGLLREHILSDCGAGCIGFCKTGQKVIPVLEEEKRLYQDVFIVQTFQQGAIDFVYTYKYIFKNFMDYIFSQGIESSLPFEGYLANAKKIDKKIFSSSYFEDFVYGASKKINIEQFIHDYYDKYNQNLRGTQDDELFFLKCIEKKGKISRAMIYLMLDKSTFGRKMANELRDKPFLYKIGKWIWNIKK